MSTFDGYVKEFPLIRIDYFRPLSGREKPLASFLSHVHSDHLQGLDTFKSQMIYCSPATREILLRLEKYPDRMNLAKGILECRQQTYKHLSKLLKTIPLETKTTIELTPGKEIQVTLFDANHCAGAVMFLIQDKQGVAILYTGDTRCEPWLVNAMIQNPVLSRCKGIDCLYLDTTFASKEDIYCEFPSKRDGITELLEKVEQYPEDTIFYFHAWTFGYENVWVALADALQSPIHVDSFRWRVYKSLANASKDGLPEAPEAARLCGYTCGNRLNHGCLTPDHNVRLHSCEKGSGCSVLEQSKSVVNITPIISRMSDGSEIVEVGTGGGQHDLTRVLELKLRDRDTLTALVEILQSQAAGGGAQSLLRDLLKAALHKGDGQITISPEELPDAETTEEKLLPYLSNLIQRKLLESSGSDARKATAPALAKQLSSEIHFPYSRHSPYSELCGLVSALKPRDIHACTVEETSWTPDIGMHALFGHICPDAAFHQDSELLKVYELRREVAADEERTRNLMQSQTSEPEEHTSSQASATSPALNSGRQVVQEHQAESNDHDSDATEPEPTSSLPKIDLHLASIVDQSNTAASVLSDEVVASAQSQGQPDKVSPERSNVLSRRGDAKRKRKPLEEGVSRGAKDNAGWAYDAAAGLNGMDWHTFGGLESTKARLMSPEL